MRTKKTKTKTRRAAGEGKNWARPMSGTKTLAPGTVWLVEVRGDLYRAEIVGRGWSYDHSDHRLDDMDAVFGVYVRRSAHVPAFRYELGKAAIDIVGHELLPQQGGSGYAVAVTRETRQGRFLVPVVLQAGAFVEPYADYVERRRAGLAARAASKARAEAAAQALAATLGITYGATDDDDETSTPVSSVDVETAWYGEETEATVELGLVGMASFALVVPRLAALGVRLSALRVRGEIAQMKLTAIEAEQLVAQLSKEAA